MSASSPQISVIIPVYNDSENLKLCLQALTNQSYPKLSYEVIVVDNSSTENLEQITSAFKDIKFDFEAMTGSYAARNKGIAISKGEILAFTDSDCVPSPEWIEQGIKSLELAQADLAGGKITFSFSPQKSTAEIFDSITALQVKKNIETRQLTVTANLFAYKYVFDAIGLFDASLKSGGDFKWTKKATDAGFKLVYAPDAEILHPARNLSSLVKKGYRVGTGQLDIQLDQDVPLSAILLKSFRDLLPPNPWGYWQFICKSGSDEARRRFAVIWVIAWICNIALSLGRLSRLMKRFSTIMSKIFFSQGSKSA
jgi:glycosyltransferase involved in cell wall biosynthesis